MRAFVPAGAILRERTASGDRVISFAELKPNQRVYVWLSGRTPDATALTATGEVKALLVSLY